MRRKCNGAKLYTEIVDSVVSKRRVVWTRSSAGERRRSQRGNRRFESFRVHHPFRNRPPLARRFRSFLKPPSGRGAFLMQRRPTVKSTGALGRENVGMSNRKSGESPDRRKPEVSSAMSIIGGLGDPKRNLA